MSSSAPAAGAPPLGTARLALVGLSTFARVAGSAVALGYLLGLVPGPIAAVIAAVALLSFGRALAPETTDAYLGLVAFGVLALAAAVGALRWGSSSLDALRGAQAVLGPTVLIEPREAAIGAGLAAGGAVVALSVWLSAHRPESLVSFLLSSGEAVVVSLMVATAFWGPAVAASGDTAELAKDIIGWALVVLVAALPAVGLSLLWRRLSRIWSWVAVGVALAAALAGTIVVPSAVVS